MPSKVVRGNFEIGGRRPSSVDISCSEDFVVHTYATNLGSTPNLLWIRTGLSTFRTPDLEENNREMVFIDLPYWNGVYCGCIGAQAGETISFVSAKTTAVGTFFTVVTAAGAEVIMKQS
jgi:hypothetical protein